jgi:hypothetical protein
MSFLNFNLVTKGFNRKIPATKDFEELFEIVKRNSLAIQQLIGYNQNRDSELEKIILDTFIEHLEAQSWDVINVNIDNIYEPNGTVIMEWDGVLFASHPSKKDTTLFFIETKQLFTVAKLNYFKARLESMHQLITNLDPKMKDANVKYLTVARRLTRFTRLGNFNIAGVVASPNIEAGVMDLLMEGEHSYITLRNNNYLVKLVDSLQVT